MDKKVDSKLMRVLSKNLETIRRNILGNNKREFAELIGISPSYLSEIVKCKFCVSLPLLEQISDKTGFTASQLLSESAECFKFSNKFQRSRSSK